MRVVMDVLVLTAIGYLIWWGTSRFLASRAAGQLGATHAELASLSQSCDGLLAELGHGMTWATGGGEVSGTCSGCRGAARLVPVPGATRGQFDVTYGWPLADDDKLLPCGGAR